MPPELLPLPRSVEMATSHESVSPLHILSGPVRPRQNGILVISSMYTKMRFQSLWVTKSSRFFKEWVRKQLRCVLEQKKSIEQVVPPLSDLCYLLFRPSRHQHYQQMRTFSTFRKKLPATALSLMARISLLQADSRCMTFICSSLVSLKPQRLES